MEADHCSSVVSFSFGLQSQKILLFCCSNIEKQSFSVNEQETWTLSTWHHNCNFQTAWGRTTMTNQWRAQLRAAGQRSRSWLPSDLWLQISLTADSSHRSATPRKSSPLRWLIVLIFERIFFHLLRRLQVRSHVCLSVCRLTFYHLSPRERTAAIRHYGTRWQLLTHAWKK